MTQPLVPPAHQERAVIYGAIWAAPDADDPVIWIGEVSSGPRGWRIAVPVDLAPDVLGALARIIRDP